MPTTTTTTTSPLTPPRPRLYRPSGQWTGTQLETGPVTSSSVTATGDSRRVETSGSEALTSRFPALAGGWCERKDDNSVAAATVVTGTRPPPRYSDDGQKSLPASARSIETGTASLLLLGSTQTADSSLSAVTTRAVIAIVSFAAYSTLTPVVLFFLLLVPATFVSSKSASSTLISTTYTASDVSSTVLPVSTVLAPISSALILTLQVHVFTVLTSSVSVISLVSLLFTLRALVSFSAVDKDVSLTSPSVILFGAFAPCVSTLTSASVFTQTSVSKATALTSSLLLLLSLTAPVSAVSNSAASASYSSLTRTHSGVNFVPPPDPPYPAADDVVAPPPPSPLQGSPPSDDNNDATTSLAGGGEVSSVVAVVEPSSVVSQPPAWPAKTTDLADGGEERLSILSTPPRPLHRSSDLDIVDSCSTQDVKGGSISGEAFVSSSSAVLLPSDPSFLSSSSPSLGITPCVGGRCGSGRRNADRAPTSLDSASESASPVVNLGTKESPVPSFSSLVIFGEFSEDDETYSRLSRSPFGDSTLGSGVVKASLRLPSSSVSHAVAADLPSSFPSVFIDLSSVYEERETIGNSRSGFIEAGYDDLDLGSGVTDFDPSLFPTPSTLFPPHPQSPSHPFPPPYPLSPPLDSLSSHPPDLTASPLLPTAEHSLPLSNVSNNDDDVTASGLSWSDEFNHLDSSATSAVLLHSAAEVEGLPQSEALRPSRVGPSAVFATASLEPGIQDGDVRATSGPPSVFSASEKEPVSSTATVKHLSSPPSVAHAPSASDPPPRPAKTAPAVTATTPSMASAGNVTGSLQPAVDTTAVPDSPPFLSPTPPLPATSLDSSNTSSSSSSSGGGGGGRDSNSDSGGSLSTPPTGYDPTVNAGMNGTTQSNDSSVGGGGGEGAVTTPSSLPLFPSASPGLDGVTDSNQNVTATSGTNSSSVLDGSGDDSGEEGGGVIDTSPTNATTRTTPVTVLPSGISPTSSSSSLDVLDSRSSLLVTSSAPGNGSVTDGPSDSVDVSPLVIALPLCLALIVFIALIVVMALFCCRSKRKKKQQSGSNDDLWVNATSQSVGAISLTIPSVTTTDHEVCLAGTNHLPLLKTLMDEPMEVLYVAVHEFPSQMDTQLPLTPGDVIQVLERSDNGWWRGNIQGDERTGWFPSSFVSPVLQDETQQPRANAETTLSVEQTPKPRISSFLVRKKQSSLSLKANNSFTVGKIEQQMCPNNVSRSPSLMTSGVSTSSAVKSDELTKSVCGKYFKALFSYKAAYGGEMTLREGDIIMGKERDRNGWMLGKKVHSKEKGWFPAVYVDQIEEGDVSLVVKSGADSDHGSRGLDREVYGLLAANRNKSPDQSWVGIEHVVQKDYTCQSGTDISLQTGSVVTVVEALESGWWLGYHGDQVGWFPGDCVELLEEKSEDNHELDSMPLIPLHIDRKLSVTASTITSSANVDNHSNVSTSKRSSLASSDEVSPELRSLESLSRDCQPAEGAKPKPNRKAPRPPAGGVANAAASAAVSGTGTLSRNLRPTRPAPAPPTSSNPQSSSSNTVSSKSSPSSSPMRHPRPESPARQARPCSPAAAVRSCSVSSGDRLGSKTPKPTTNQGAPRYSPKGISTSPKKQRKPKVVRIPKEKLGLDKISSCPAPTFKPPKIADDVSGAVEGGEGSHPFSQNGALGSVKDARVDDKKNGCHSAVTNIQSSGDEDSQCETSSHHVFDDACNDITDCNDNLHTVHNKSVPNTDHVDVNSSHNHKTKTKQDIVPSISGTELPDGNSNTTSSVFRSRDSTDSLGDFPALSEEMSISMPELDEAFKTVEPLGHTENNDLKKTEQSDVDKAKHNGLEKTAEPSVDDSEEPLALTVDSSNGVSYSVTDADSGVKTETNNFTILSHAHEDSISDRKEKEGEKHWRPEQAQNSVRAYNKDTALPELPDAFPNPPTIGANSTAKYVPPPAGLLEGDEEFSVDGPLSAVPEENDNSKDGVGGGSGGISNNTEAASSFSKPSGGHWRFHSSNGQGQNQGHDQIQGSRSTPVKLTKVAPPVVPNADAANSGSGEARVVEVPPAGTSGRVSKIVHQINRMASVEEHQPGSLPRRTSLQHNNSVSSSVSASSSTSSAPSSVVSSASSAAAGSCSSSSDSKATEEERRNMGIDSKTEEEEKSGTRTHGPCMAEGENVQGGSAHEDRQGGLANGDILSAVVNEESPKGNIETIGGQSDVKFPSEEDLPAERDSKQERQSRSRESTPESEGEGNGRYRKSNKKSRAPPPPRSPPPSRKLQETITIGQDTASNC